MTTRSIMNRFRYLLLIALSLHIGLSTASATIMKALSLAELVEQSSLILEGQVLGIRSEWTSDRREIVTYIDIIHAPTNVLKDLPQINANGKRIGNTITLKLLGGIADYVTPEGKVKKIALYLVGNPSFRRGEHVLLFAQPGRGRRYGGFFKLVGMSQGKYRIENGIAKRKTNGAHFLGAAPDAQLNEQPLANLKGMIVQEIQTQQREQAHPQNKQ